MNGDKCMFQDHISDKPLRTIKVRLERTDERVSTIMPFNRACQRILDIGYTNKRTNELDLACYDNKP